MTFLQPSADLCYYGHPENKMQSWLLSIWPFLDEKLRDYILNERNIYIAITLTSLTKLGLGLSHFSFTLCSHSVLV